MFHGGHTSLTADLLISRNVTDLPQQVNISGHTGKVLIESNHSSIATAAAANDVLWHLEHTLSQPSKTSTIHLIERGGLYDERSFTLNHSHSRFSIQRPGVAQRQAPERDLLVLNQECENVHHWSGPGKCGRVELSGNVQVPLLMILMILILILILI